MKNIENNTGKSEKLKNHDAMEDIEALEQII
jgi:hypothetical protein